MKQYVCIALTLIIMLVVYTTTSAQSTEPVKEQVQVLYQQASEYHNAGNYEKALELYTKVIELDATHADAYWNRGNLYGLQEKYDLAAADLRKVIAVFPEWADGYGNLGWYLMLQGKFKEAREACQKAYQLAPENFAWSMNLGHAYLLTGDPEIARTYYEKALALITSENEFETGPAADFGLFIENGWQVETSRQELAWMTQEFDAVYQFHIEADTYSSQARELFQQGRYLLCADR